MPSAKYTLITNNSPNVVTNSKNSLQKLYTSRKSWLHSNNNSVKSTEPTVVGKNNNIYENVRKIEQTDKHVYENVEKQCLLSKNDSGYDSLDENLDTQNISIVEVSSDNNSITTTASMNDNKLKIVIDNFDKILDEYQTSLPMEKPKLEKQKSCSIIESKCILKKSVSEPKQNTDETKSTTPATSPTPAETTVEKTKSMVDLNIIVNKTPATKSDTITKSTTKPPPAAKIVEARKIFDQKPPQKSTMIRAKSTFDISSTNAKQMRSKIPVKSPALSKALSPSTPVDLNHIVDRKPGCTTTATPATMTQKTLTLVEITDSQNSQVEQLRDPVTKLNVTLKDNLRKIRSITNDLNATSLSNNQTLDKCITTGNRILKKVEQMNGVNSALQRRLTYTKQKKELLEKKSAPQILPSSNNSNVTSFALLKKQSMNGNKKTEPAIKIKEAIPKKKPIQKPTSDLIKTSIQKIEENAKKTAVNSKAQSENIFGLKSTYIIKKQEETKKTAKKLAEITSKVEHLIRQGQENYEIVKFSDCPAPVDNEATVNVVRVIETKDQSIQLIKLPPESIQKPDVRYDGDRICTKIEHNDKNNHLLEFVQKDVKKTADDDVDRCSEDSGNISNENELDYENEEVEIAIPKRKTSSASDEFLLECGVGSIESNHNSSDETDCNKDKFKTFDINLDNVIKEDKSKIFFRPGTLAHLEAQRDSLLTGRVIHLQAHCRGFLARKCLQHRRLQETAVRCIQRNVRAFMAVRDWPWWRLLVRVTPLLNVHRTEEELKKKTEELEILRAKVEKLEAERTTLKHDNDKLEAKLSEMTADLAEEHSTATLAAERLDAETSERIRLERELSEVQNKNKSLQQQSERLEMELLYARSDINGVISEEDEDGESDHSIYKAKYERAVRELEFTRRRLQQQHEDDLEQLVGLKKQLEKKLSDAYEEVEEQRQVVGQWKRKVQKLTSEMNDLRLLIEEQNARNNLLEKKQRKFDSETQLLNDELRQERQQRERLSREKDLILAEKYTLESNLADVRLELELKEERLNALQQEYNDLTFGGKSEDEVATLRKQKQDAERRIHEQEEELDDLAGQVQMLEQAKVRLEMSLEQQRKEARREAQQRDDELEEVRCNAQKKVKALESQLENEHEERTLLLREKHSLERRLAALTEAGRTEREGDEQMLQRLKRDLRRTKALLRDAQTMLERSKADSPGKAVIRQLRNQLDDLECARAAAVKARQSAESELAEVQSQLDEAHRQKAEAEERANIANRERAELRTQLEENEEELAEVLKKYRSTVQQLSSEQMALQEQLSLVSELEAERNSLKEQLSELTTKLESMENLADPSSTAHAKRMELRAKELESKLEFEQTTRARLEVQIARLKETTDKLQTDLAQARTREQQAQDNLRKVQRTLRELRDEHAALTARENEATQKRKELEKKLEASEAETAAARADLRLALQRIDDLQAAIQGELEDTPSDHSDSDNDSFSSDESIDTFLANHKISPTKLDRTALRLDTSPRLNESKVKVGTPEDSFA